MSTQIIEWLEVIAKILLRCWIVGFLLMLFSFVVFMLTGEIIHELHGKMFGLFGGRSLGIDTGTFDPSYGNSDARWFPANPCQGPEKGPVVPPPFCSIPPGLGLP